MSVAAHSPSVGDILVAGGVTTPEVVRRAITQTQSTGERVADALVGLGVSADHVQRAVARQHRLPYLSRDELPVPLPVLKNLSPKYLKQYTVCPVSVEGGSLTIAVADPLNPMIIDDLRQSTGLEVHVVVCAAEAINEAIDRTYEGGNTTALQRIVEGMEDESLGDGGDEDVNNLRDMPFEAPGVRLVNLLLENAVASEASDNHTQPFEDTLRIRYRIDGILYEQEAPPRRLQAAVTSRIKIMAGMNIAGRRPPPAGPVPGTPPGPRVGIPGAAHPPGF